MAEAIDNDPTTQTDPTDTSDAAATASSILQEGWADDADALATQTLTGLAQVRQARINQQQRQLASLTAQYGPTDPGVTALTASIVAQNSFAAVLGATRDIATTATPIAPAAGWILQGCVRDDTLSPIPRFTVRLIDGTKSWISAYGYAYTDASGNFSLSSASGQTPATTPLTAYLEVLNEDARPVFMDSATFTIALGGTLYRDIILASQTPLGGSPGGATVSEAGATTTT